MANALGLLAVLYTKRTPFHLRSPFCDGGEGGDLRLMIDVVG